MALSESDARDLINEVLWPELVKERRRLDRIDLWWRWEHEKPHNPKHANKEYKELGARAITPWLGLVVSSVSQMLYVEGYRSSGASDNSDPWSNWQANGLDARQIAIHRAALAFGLSYVTVLPGVSFTGEPQANIRGVSPRRMVTVYEDPCEDDWPALALRMDPIGPKATLGYKLRLYDDEFVHYLKIDKAGGGITYSETKEHGAGVCPVVRYANQLDLEGRATGEVEPFIPVAARIDQTTFDRLVVQRFASWVVRTISGMSPPEEMTVSESQAWSAVEKLRLRAEDILVAEDPDTKFGSLPASDLAGFIAAHESDVRSLAATSQTPPHHLLGQMANLSAEALAAAESSLNRKVEERKHLFGESHEQTLRLSARVMGDLENANDLESQVRWRDMESRSLAQTADALGKLATMLGVPVEMLWEKIPGWSDQDVERAKALVTEGDAITNLTKVLEQQAAAQTPPVPAPADALVA